MGAEASEGGGCVWPYIPSSLLSVASHSRALIESLAFGPISEAANHEYD